MRIANPFVFWFLRHPHFFTIHWLTKFKYLTGKSKGVGILRVTFPEECHLIPRTNHPMPKFIFLLLFSLTAIATDPDPYTLIKSGHYKQARTILEAKLKQNPKDANALWQMAQVKIVYKDLDGALQMAEQAVALDDNNSYAHCMVADAVGSKIETAGIFSKLGMGKRIRNEAERAVALDPKNVKCLDIMVDFHREAPGILGGDKAKIPEYIQKMIAADPVQGHMKEVELALKDKQIAKIEPAYKALLAEAPHDYRALVLVGGYYLSDGGGKKFDLAEKYARDAIKIDPNSMDGYSLLAQALIQQNKDAEADAVLAQAEKDAPYSLNAHYQAGKAFLVLNRNLPTAEKYIRKYLTQEPEPTTPPLAAAHWRLGLVLEKEGKKPEALKEVQLALQMKPDLKQAEPDLKRLKG